MGARDQRNVGLIPLAQSMIHKWKLGLIQVAILTVLGHTHNGKEPVSLGDANGPPDRVLMRPKLFRHEAIDHDHFGAFFHIGRAERAACQQADTER